MKSKIVIVILIITLVLIITTLLINRSNSNPEISNRLESNLLTPSPEPSPSEINDSTIKFDVEQVKVGDKIGDMKIVEINGRKMEKATKASAYVKFEGQTTLTGDVDYIGPGGLMQENMCFQNLDDKSLAKIPRMIGDTREIWFCFNDFEDAKTKLMNKYKAGKTTIAIDHYEINSYPSEVYNKADLISVVE